MPSVGKLFAIAAILALALGVARWPALGIGEYTIQIKDRAYGFSREYWAFSIGAIFSVFAAVYYWVPILFPRSLSSRMSHLHFWLSALAAFGFLLLAPGLQALSAPRDATVSEGRTMMATLLVANASALLFLVAQAIFVASSFWITLYGRKFGGRQ